MDKENRGVGSGQLMPGEQPLEPLLAAPAGIFQNGTKPKKKQKLTAWKGREEQPDSRALLPPSTDSSRQELFYKQDTHCMEEEEDLEKREHTDNATLMPSGHAIDQSGFCRTPCRYPTDEFEQLDVTQSRTTAGNSKDVHREIKSDSNINENPTGRIKFMDLEKIESVLSDKIFPEYSHPIENPPEGSVMSCFQNDSSRAQNPSQSEDEPFKTFADAKESYIIGDTNNAMPLEGSSMNKPFNVSLDDPDSAAHNDGSTNFSVKSLDAEISPTNTLKGDISSGASPENLHDDSTTFPENQSCETPLSKTSIDQELSPEKSIDAGESPHTPVDECHEIKPVLVNTPGCNIDDGTTGTLCENTDTIGHRDENVSPDSESDKTISEHIPIDIIHEKSHGEPTAEDESPQDNNGAKVVTFAEDKEVFHMGHVVPASITVHLDTPVSSIAHGDVQEVTPTTPDPVIADAAAVAQPISGILKSDDVASVADDAQRDPCSSGDIAEPVSDDRKLVNDEGNASAPPRACQEGKTGSDPLTHDDLVSYPDPNSETPLVTEYGQCEIIDKAALLGEAAGGSATRCEEGKGIVGINVGVGEHVSHSIETGAISTEETLEEHVNKCDEKDEINGAGGEGEQAEEDTVGHREFIVESVPDVKVLSGPEGTKSTPVDDVVFLNSKRETYAPLVNGGGAIGSGNPTDIGSHSTDSNYQDTIGPLDNPQFLKTLNYTASQAFDQDEHFGLHSAGLDARSLAGLQDPPDLDGGWAWVVLTASFVAATLLGASVYAAGVLMGAILEQIENDLTKASWVGSVFVCVMSLSGPFVGSVLNRLGARTTVSCAGLVITVGFIGASMSTTIVQLILTHGVVAGLGAGFTVNPLFVTVGQYFNKYRGFACGIVAMGAGAGMLSGGAFVSYLLTMFDLSGTYLIWAGMMLHVTPMGLLLLPSPEERVRKLERDLDACELKAHPDGASVTSEPNSGANSLFGSVNHSMLSGIDRISIGAQGRRVLVPGSFVSRRPSKLMVPPATGGGGHGSDAEVPLLRTALHNEMSRSSHSVNRASGYTKSSLNKSGTDISSPLSPIGGIGAPRTPILEGHELFVTNGTTPGSLTHHHLSSSSILSPSSNTLNYMVSPSGIPPPPYSRHQFRSSQGHSSQYTSTSHISARLSMRSGMASTAPRGEFDNESITSAFVAHLRPRDTLSPRQNLGSRSISTLIGSIASLPTSLAIVKDDLRRFETTGPYDGSLKGYLISILDSMRILRNIPFCIFVLTNFFWALGESPVLIHLPSYVISRGTSQMQASSLYTSMGIASMSGRFLSGLVATDINIGPVLMYTGSLGVAGLVVCLSPLITTTFAQQVVFSFLVGLYTGALVPLTSLITIELLGLGELSLGFGLISMSQGFGYLIGPPLSSVIVKAIGFEKAFVCSGFVLLAGSMLAMVMTLFLAAMDVDDDLGLDVPVDGGMDKVHSHPLGDLERALQKLADSNSSDLDHGSQGAAGNESRDPATADDAYERNDSWSWSSAADKAPDEGASKNATADGIIRNNSSPRTLEDCVILLEGEALLPSSGEEAAIRRDLLPQSLINDRNTGFQVMPTDDLALPVKGHDELYIPEKLDTIVEVVGK